MRASIALSALVLLVLCSGIAIAAPQYTSLFLVSGSQKCGDDGKLSFKVYNNEKPPLSMDDIKISIDYTPSGRTATEKPDAYTFEPEGAWDKDSIFFSTTKSDARYSTYTSDFGQLANEGSYYVTLSYPGCKSSSRLDPKCQEEFGLLLCPGFKYTCEISNKNIQVNSCDTGDDNVFRATFSGINKDQKENIDPNNDVFYYLFSNKRTFLGIKKLPSMKITAVGTDTYTMELPLQPEEQIEAMIIRAEKCKLMEEKITSQLPGIVNCGTSQISSETLSKTAEAHRLAEEAKEMPTPTEEPIKEEEAEEVIEKEATEEEIIEEGAEEAAEEKETEKAAVGLSEQAQIAVLVLVLAVIALVAYVLYKKRK